MTRRGQRLLFWVAAVSVLISDQLSKRWVVENFQKYVSVQPVEWLESIFSFTFLDNTGVAFGLFSGFGGIFKVLSTLIILALLVFYYQLEEEEHWLTHLALGVQIGGALGNLVDRFVRGAVVDFIDVNFWPFKEWPVFNIADSAIVVGVGLLLLAALLEEWARSPQGAAGDAPPIVLEDEEALHA
jgi:signal peptidase II